jgi:hypothetical protein
MMLRSFVAIRTRYAIDERETMLVNLLLFLDRMYIVLTMWYLVVSVADLVCVRRGEWLFYCDLWGRGTVHSN